METIKVSDGTVFCGSDLKTLRSDVLRLKKSVPWQGTPYLILNEKTGMYDFGNQEEAFRRLCGEAFPG